LERNEAIKALEMASTLILPSQKNLSCNTQALDLLRESPFVRRGKAFVNSHGRQEGGEGQQQDESLDAQHLVIVEYPENRGRRLQSVKVRR